MVGMEVAQGLRAKPHFSDPFLEMLPVRGPNWIIFTIESARANADKVAPQSFPIGP